MSRVDESRSEQRAEEARLADRRAKELQQKQRTSEASAFDRALAEKSGHRQQGAALRDAAGRARVASDGAATERAGCAEHEERVGTGPDAGDAAATERGKEAEEGRRPFAKRLDEQRRPAQAEPPPRQGAAQARAPHAETRGKALLAADQKQAQLAGDLLKPDAKGEDLDRARATGGGQGGPARKGGPLQRAGDDAGSNSGGRQQGKGTSDDPSAAAFRLPPAALMAPPPLARPRESGNASLRAFTKEIVDKIVSRVMVGTNEKGVPEFRLELKSSVLKGLSIKVSGGRGGRIRAVFSGADKDVLAALEQSSRELKDALAARGLVLEDISFEAGDAR